MKQTPKSCSCQTCRLGKAKKKQKFLMKLNERGFRHQSKIALKTGKEEEVGIAPYGSYNA
jgi:hypothetical protein